MDHDLEKKKKIREIVFSILGCGITIFLVSITPNINIIIFDHWTRIVWLTIYILWVSIQVYIMIKMSDQLSIFSLIIEIFLILAGWIFILRDGMQLNTIKETTCPYVQTITLDPHDSSNSIDPLLSVIPTPTTTPTKYLMRFTDTQSPTATNYPKIEVCYKPKDEEGSRYIRSSPDNLHGIENVITSIRPGYCFDIYERTDLLVSSGYSSSPYRYWLHLAKIIDKDGIALTNEDGTLSDGWILYDEFRFIFNTPFSDFDVKQINTAIPSSYFTKTPTVTQTFESTMTPTPTK